MKLAVVVLFVDDFIIHKSQVTIIADHMPKMNGTCVSEMEGTQIASKMKLEI